MTNILLNGCIVSVKQSLNRLYYTVGDRDATHHLLKIVAIEKTANGTGRIGVTEIDSEFVVDSTTKVGDFIDTRTGDVATRITAIMKIATVVETIYIAAAVGNIIAMASLFVFR